ncbi:MAG: hypothetical protein ACK2UQ_06275, partial [Anaerolineae bacterium]
QLRMVLYQDYRISSFPLPAPPPREAQGEGNNFFCVFLGERRSPKNTQLDSPPSRMREGG